MFTNYLTILQNLFRENIRKFQSLAAKSSKIQISRNDAQVRFMARNLNFGKIGDFCHFFRLRNPRSPGVGAFERKYFGLLLGI